MRCFFEARQRRGLKGGLVLGSGDGRAWWGCDKEEVVEEDEGEGGMWMTRKGSAVPG